MKSSIRIIKNFRNLTELAGVEVATATALFNFFIMIIRANPKFILWLIAIKTLHKYWSDSNSSLSPLDGKRLNVFS